MTCSICGANKRDGDTCWTCYDTFAAHAHRLRTACSDLFWAVAECWALPLLRWIGRRK